MKQLLLTLSICLISCSAIAQAPNWLWAKRATGVEYEGGVNLAMDRNGNTYVFGYMSGSVATFGSTTLSYDGSNDIFLVKYDTAGNVIWARSAGGILDDTGMGIGVDSNGNCYIAGHFSSPSITFGATTLTNAGVKDIFVVKYDSSGNVVWANRAGGSEDELGAALAVDASGNCYITGLFSSSTISFGTTTLTHSGLGDIFVVKYDAAGNVVWAKRDGGTGPEMGTAIAVDDSSNIYVVSQFDAVPTIIGTTVFANAGYKDMILIKYNSFGNLVWAQHTGGTENDIGDILAVDGSGNSYVSGYFDSPSFSFGPSTLTHSGGGDIYLAKYDAAGNPAWAVGAGGVSYDRGYDVAVNSNGQSYLAGMFASPSLSFGTTTLTNAGGSDLFVASFDAAGNAVWAKSVGGTGYEAANGILVDAQGATYITGHFNSSPTVFGPIALTNPANFDMFFAKLSSCAVAPLQPGVITGNVTPCIGASQTYSVPTGGNTNSYVWTLPPGWTGSSTNNSISANVGATGGNITVAAANACGISAVQTLAISPLSAPMVPALIMGDTTVCLGSLKTYSVSVDTTATSYTWTLPMGWTGTSNTNSITATAGIQSGNITVTAANNCGSSSAQSLTATVLPSPVPVISQSGTDLSTSVTFAAYQWYFNANPISGAFSQTYTPTVSGNYFVVVIDSSTGCAGQSNIISIILNMDEISANEKLVVYPNPVKEVLHLKTEGKTLGAVQLIDYLGRTLLEFNAVKKETYLDMHRFPVGLYLLRVGDTELKVIKE